MGERRGGIRLSRLKEDEGGGGAITHWAMRKSLSAPCNLHEQNLMLTMMMPEKGVWVF